jgi:hypothetical protein
MTLGVQNEPTYETLRKERGDKRGRDGEGRDGKEIMRKEGGRKKVSENLSWYLNHYPKDSISAVSTPCKSGYFLLSLTICHCPSSNHHINATDADSAFTSIIVRLSS